MNKEKAIEKIRGLLALATSPNEHEAAAAAAKAADLLQKYNLEMTDIDSNYGKGMVEVAADSTVARLDFWRNRLAGIVSDHTFTKVYFVRKYAPSDRTGKMGLRYGFVFYGRNGNAEVAAFLFDFLYRTLLELSEQETSKYAQEFKAFYGVSPFQVKNLGNEHPNVYRNSWLRGAVAGIATKLREQRQQVDNTVKAIIKLRDEEVEQAWEEFSRDMRKRNSTYQGQENAGAKSKGFTDGYNLPVHTPLKGGQK